MKIDIVYNSGNSRISFDEEIVHFDISIQNPERLLYNVTIPTIVANIALESINSAFRSMRRGDKIEVYNESGHFLFHLMTISVTFIEGTGRVEIEASGPPLIGDGFPHGMLKVTEDLIKEVYGNDVESMDEYLSRDKRSYLRNREDLMLSALWTDREELMYITPSYHKMYDEEDTKQWTIFKEGSSLVPDYEVKFEDIIDVNITPARPPVTELRTRELSNELDVVELKNVQYARTYYLEGNNITAVYIYELSGSSYLRWSDGIVTDLGLGLGPNQIVGIFSDSYIEWTTTTYSYKVLTVKDRETRNTIATFNIAESTDFMSDSYGLKTEPLVTTSDRHGEVCWFERATFSGTVFGIRKTENGYSMLSTTTAVPRDYEFVTAKEGQQALYAYFSVAEQMMHFIVIRVRHDGSIDRRTSQKDMNYTGLPTQYSPRVVDAIYDIDGTREVYLLKYAQGPNVETAIERPNEPTVFIRGEARFAETSLDVEPEDLKLVVLFYDLSGLAELGIYDIDGNILTRETKLRAMNLFGTTSGSTVMVNYHNKAGTYMLQDAERTVLLFSNSSVPWAAINPRPLAIRQPLQKGDENIIDLPFVVEGIGDIDIPTEEVGRIELDIAGYNIQGDTNKFNVKDMHLPPLMSTFYVKLDEGKPMRKMKVVAIYMNYDGVVSMRLSGILVPAKSALEPPSIASTAYCDTSGTPQAPNYQYRISVTNNNPDKAWLNVTIAGVLISREVNAGATSIFTRSSSTPWTSVTVSAYASKEGYLDSDLVTVSRPVTCTPPVEGATWHKIGLSSQSVCFDLGYELEGTSCSTIGETTTAASGGGPCYDYECK